MTEYEKETIEEVKDILRVGWMLERADIDNIETILTLVDKQQKELEEYKKEYKITDKEEWKKQCKNILRR